MDQTRDTPLKNVDLKRNAVGAIKRDTALEHAPFAVTIDEINEFFMFETPLWHLALLLPVALVLRLLGWMHRRCGSEFIRPSRRRTLQPNLQKHLVNPPRDPVPLVGVPIHLYLN